MRLSRRALLFSAAASVLALQLALAPLPFFTAPVAAAELGYIEIMTGGASPDEAVPMVVAVHGLGDRPDSFSFLFRPLALPARIILPRGPARWGEDGYSWFPFVIGAEGERFAAGVRNAAGRLSNLIAILRASKPTLGRPIVTGFSQGGILSFSLAALHPDEISAALPISGFLPPELWPDPTTDPPPPGARLPVVRAFHGEADTVVSVDPARWSTAVLDSRGYDAEIRTYPGLGHSLNAEERSDFYDALGAAILAAANWRGGDATQRPPLLPPQTPAATPSPPAARGGAQALPRSPRIPVDPQALQQAPAGSPDSPEVPPGPAAQPSGDSGSR